MDEEQLDGTGRQRVGDEHPKEVFDRSTLLERLGGDADLVEEIVQMFLEDAPEHLAQLRLALDDPTALWRRAHTLKGAAGNVAAGVLAKVAAQLEHAAKRPDAARFAPLLQALEREFDRFRRAVTVSSSPPSSS